MAKKVKYRVVNGKKKLLRRTVSGKNKALYRTYSDIIPDGWNAEMNEYVGQG